MVDRDVSARREASRLGVRPGNHVYDATGAWAVNSAAMTKTYRPYKPDQLLLIPPALADRVPEDHLPRFVSDVVDSLGLGRIEETYGDERAYQPYHPRIMVKLRLYASCTGVYSSRRIGRRVLEQRGVRFLAAGNTPDFRCRSRRRIDTPGRRYHRSEDRLLMPSVWGDL